MTPEELAERLVPDAPVGLPYPHFVRDDALPSSLVEGLLEWMETRAAWRLHTASFFEQYELDLAASAVPQNCQVIFAAQTLSAIALRYGAVFKREMTTHARVTAHRLVSGQTIGIHTDEPHGDSETHRLLVHLNRGWCAENGGEMLLLKGRDISALHSIIPPHSNRAVGFEMSDHSFHAVAKVTNWERYTLIFSFWANDRPHPPRTMHVPMPQREQVLVFLREYGAASILHSGSCLLNHLIGVERTLDRWGAPLHTRLAGLLHSIYGTEGFPAHSDVTCKRIAAMVGREAAELVFLFCEMDQNSLLDSVSARRPLLRARNGALLNVTLAQIDELLLINLANMADQLPRIQSLKEVVHEDSVAYRRIRPYLTIVVRSELDALFERLLARNVDAESENSIEAIRSFISETGGDDILYGRTTLSSFLSAIEAWVSTRDGAAEVRIAAIAHGLYGWKADFSEQNRAIVRVVAGEAAERLAWLFAASDDAAIAEAHEAFEGAGEFILKLKGMQGRTEIVTPHEISCLSMLARAVKEIT